MAIELAYGLWPLDHVILFVRTNLPLLGKLVSCSNASTKGARGVSEGFSGG